MAHVREKPPLRLHWSAVTPAGRTFRWGEDEPLPENMPSGVSFSTTMPGGFEQASLTLPRKPDRDHADLERLSTLTAYGPGVEVAWEGRLETAPRTSGDQMAASPGLVGWQAHLEDDRSAVMVYRDVDLSRWQGASMARRITLAGGNWASHDAQVGSDDAAGPELVMTVAGLENSKPIVTALYRSPVDLGSVWTSRRVIAGSFNSDAIYEVHVYLSTNDGFSAGDSSGDVATSTPGSGTVTATASGRRFAGIEWYYSIAGDWAQTYGLAVKAAVYGNHGLTKRGTEPTAGFYASDIVEHAVSAFAPMLSTDVQGSQYIIQQAAYLEPTTAAEIVRDATRYGLQDWAVWEDKTFYWHNRGYRGRSWRARIAPSQLQETGPSVERLFESVIVQYQDVDGTTRTIGPPNSGANVEDATLQDDDTENPAVKLGLKKRALLTTGIDALDNATQIGARFLEEQKLLDASGSASLVGHVEDNRGVLHPAWKVRAGDTITFVDAADPYPRRIVRTNYDHASRTCSIDIDAPPEAMQALLERLNADLIRVGL